MDQDRREEYVSFLSELADASGDAILPYFRTPVAVDNKADGSDPGRGKYDPVTEADKAAEATIRKLIGERYPAHGIHGEEEGHQPGSSPETWVIDPIDGTRAFVAGAPLWGTLIALNDGKYPVCGVMDQPYLGERYFGTGQSAWMERFGVRRELQTSTKTDLGDAIVMATHPMIFTTPPEREQFAILGDRSKMTRWGCDCYGYTLLAMGTVDIVAEPTLMPYDIQALIPIIEGAGGIVTTWRGKTHSMAAKFWPLPIKIYTKQPWRF